jgi:hypothetical protein
MCSCTSVVSHVNKKLRSLLQSFKNTKFDGVNFWSKSYSGSKWKLIKWHLKNGILAEFDDIYEDSYYDGLNNDFYFTYSNEYIWILPRHADYAYKIEANTGIISIVEELSAALRSDRDNRVIPKFMRVPTNFNDSFFAYNFQKGAIIEFNVITFEYTERQVKYTADEIDEISSQLTEAFMQNVCEIKADKATTFFEAANRSLPIFIDYIVKYGDSDEEVSARDRRKEAFIKTYGDIGKNTGESIYSYIKSALL